MDAMSLLMYTMAKWPRDQAWCEPVCWHCHGNHTITRSNAKAPRSRTSAMRWNMQNDIKQPAIAVNIVGYVVSSQCMRTSLGPLF